MLSITESLSGDDDGDGDGDGDGGGGGGDDSDGGDDDMIFPIKNIKNCIILKGGTHIMIVTKYKWLNENLPKIILE